MSRGDRSWEQRPGPEEEASYPAVAAIGGVFLMIQGAGLWIIGGWAGGFVGFFLGVLAIIGLTRVMVKSAISMRPTRRLASTTKAQAGPMTM